MTKSEPTTVPIGLRQPGSTQFFRQVLVKTPEAPFSIELPGAVRQTGGVRAHSILPFGRLMLPNEKSVTAAMITGAVLDEREMDHAISGLTEHLRTRSPTAFSIRFSTPDTSYAQLISRAVGFTGGCGCADCGDGDAFGAVLRGTISVGAAAGPHDDLTWTKPINAQVKASIEDQTYFGEEEISLNIGSLFFDCYSDWEGFFQRRTRCYGNCPPPQLCICDVNSKGVPQVFCRGWRFCFCK